MRALVLIVLLCWTGLARPALDLPVEVLQSHLTFKEGELLVSSEGHRLASVKLTYKGKTHLLQGEILAGLGQPELTAVQLKLAGKQRCAVDNACLDYVIPVVEIGVWETPEDPDCLNGCTVSFIFEDSRIFRRTVSRTKDGVIHDSTKEFASTVK